MPFEVLVEQIKTLPEESIEEVSDYVQFLIYKNEKKANSLSESEKDFNEKMQKGYDDAKNGRVKSLDESFASIKKGSPNEL